MREVKPSKGPLPFDPEVFLEAADFRQERRSAKGKNRTQEGYGSFHIMPYLPRV